MMKTCSILLFCLFALGMSHVHGQSVFHHYFEDTIRPKQRISGSLDSVDCVLGRYQSTLPASYRPLATVFNYAHLSQMQGQQFKRRFSAIPHIAFGYSMGSKLDQLGRITYTQTIDTNTSIQFDYVRRSNNGIIRNGAFESNQVDFSLMHHGKWYGTYVNVHFLGGNFNVNGGLLGDTLSNDFSLDFQLVKKENAKRIYRNFEAKWENYLSFIHTDTTTGSKAGLYAGVHFDIHNSRYQENDTLFGLYPMINYDSLATNDYWEKSSIGFPVGLFFDSEKLAIRGGIKFSYWDYDNRSYHLDTTEAAVFLNAQFSNKGWLLRLQGSNTVQGAKGEQSAQLLVSKSLKQWQFGIRGSYQAMYPMLYQRYFFGNNAAYSWTNKQLTQWLDAQINVKNSNRIIPLELTGYFQQIDRALYFDSTTWKNDTNYTVAGVQLRLEYSYKKLLVQAFGLVQQGSNDFIPKTIVSGRIAYRGGLFKAKKLQTVTGIEIGQFGTYNNLTYNAYMNSFQYGVSSSRFANMPKLSFYSQYDLGYFRWFIRVENIEQAIIKSKNQEAVGFQVTPLQFRFGVSWDFFN